MKRLKEALAATLPIIVFTLFTLIFSCEAKREYDFDCKKDVTIYLTGITCPLFLTIHATLKDQTFAEMRKFENANGCHCMIAFCPEY
jgi:hypothetical protein